MKSKTENILVFMNVLTWIVFIGLMVQTGTLLSSYVIGLFRSADSKDLYGGLNLETLRQASFIHYTCVAFVRIIILTFKTCTAYLVISILSKINLSSPFKMTIALLIEKVSYMILATWGLTVLGNAYMHFLYEENLVPVAEGEAGEYVFFAGIIFIIAQIFKKGIEIQSENELTV